MQLSKTRRLALDAMLAAMYVALGLVSLKLPNMKISPDSLPILVGAALLGPLDGMAVGLVGSFISQLLNYGLTVTTPLWILPAGLRGLLVGLYAKKHGYSMSLGQTALISTVSALAVTALNTLIMYIDSVVFDYFSWAYVFGLMIPRIIAGLLTALLFSLLLPQLLKSLQKLLGMEEKKENEREQNGI